MKINMILYKTVRLILIPILKVFFMYKINSKNNLPNNGRFIICSNHISLMDPFFLIVGQKRPIYFMGKSQLFKNKILGKFLNLIGTFAVERGKGDGKAISIAENILGEENVLGIFFEGQRSKDGQLLRPRLGVSVIANETRAPVIPVCITSGKDGRVRPFKKVVVSFSDPVTVEELGLKENSSTLDLRKSSKMLMDKIRIMRERDLMER